MSGGSTLSEDGDVAAQLQRGESSAIASLYDRYAGMAFGLAYRVLNDRAAAEDVVQEAFMSVWRNSASFDAGRGSVRSWLLTIVRNRAIDRVRGSGRSRKETPLEFVELIAPVPDAWESVSLELERRQVREAVAVLPAAQRQTLELAYFAGLTHMEIAKQMAVPLGTVKGRMRMGLEKVRAFLQARGLEG